MKPDQKYMPAFRKSSDGDIEFAPFTQDPNFTSPSMGWIPIFFYNNPSSGNNMNNATMPINTQFQLSTTTNPLFPLPNIMSNNMPIPNNYSPFKSSDEENNSSLFSYNNPTKNNSDINSNKMENTTSNKPNPIDVLRDFDLDLDEDLDLARNCCDNNINMVYNHIYKNNNGIFTLLQAYDIPMPIIKLIIRRIIKLTINICKKE